MKIKKGDFAIIVVMILALAGWLGKDFFLPDAGNKKAVISVDSREYMTVPLGSSHELQGIPVKLPGNEYVHVVTDGEQIWVDDASCPDKICVKTGKISKSGQSIVCLPNKVVVRIDSSEKAVVDEVAF